MDLALLYTCLEAGRHTGTEIIEINLNTTGTHTFGLSWDWILSSNQIELDRVLPTLEKQTRQTSEGEDYKVMLFTSCSDLGRNAAKERKKKSDAAKRGVKEGRGGDKTKGRDEELLQLTNTGQSLSIKESLCSLSLSKEHQL